VFVVYLFRVFLPHCLFFNIFFLNLPKIISRTQFIHANLLPHVHSPPGLVFEDGGGEEMGFPFFGGVLAGAGEVEVVADCVVLYGEGAVSGLYCWGQGYACFIEGVTAVVFGLLHDGRLVVFVFLVVVQHVLPLLWDEVAVLLLKGWLGGGDSAAG
jgi:hypothetical protein